MSAHKAEGEHFFYPAHPCGQSTGVTRCASSTELIRAARACRLHPWCVQDVRWILPGTAYFLIFCTLQAPLFYLRPLVVLVAQGT